MERQYEYFAIVTETWPRVEDPRHVCRRWVDDEGKTHDEAFTTNLVWEPTTALSQAESGTGGVHRIDAAAATRFEHLQRERMSYLAPLDGRYSYFAWLDYRTDVDDPDGVIRTWKGPQGFELEERYLTGSGWERSHLLEDLERGRKDGELVPIDQAAVERIVQRREQRRAERSPEVP
ncbi:hypothetical protein [Lentzea nigeriaca]|uniref:hypothetical protein n=1 Tax=Lentzea nigeriaca TaxID=1128665 RepID=UPI00195E23A9|nr:hypothetical protein [Lentzea nigeriaca]MBM7860315.1 hypothetical protein [Lentzea nigeriaca]